MGLDKLFKKAEDFFGLEASLQAKKKKKRRKLQEALEEKKENLKSKISKESDTDKKDEYTKQLDMIKKYMKELKGEDG